MYDLLIRNVRVLDGTGAPWYRADVAVENGRIVAVGPLAGCAAEQVLDGEDQYLAPGFIDIHSHSDTALPKHPLSESRILQGVTTEIGGNCGMSAAPVEERNLELLRRYMGDMEYSWRSMGQFLDYIEEQQPSVNFGCVAGHGTVRLAVMGFSDQKATPEQMARMKTLLGQCMAEGAFAMSSGLIYPPGCYADTEELAALASVVKPYGGFYMTHMRNEGALLVEATKEALDIARTAGVPLQISHHKCGARPYWQVNVHTTLAMIKQARRQGMDVTCDQYPYRASATSLTSNIPKWAFEGGMDAMLDRLRDPETRAKIHEECERGHLGRWDQIVVSWTTPGKFEWVIGKSVLEIAETMGVTGSEAVFEILLDSEGRASEVNYGICEEDIETIMVNPFVMTGSDGEAMPLTQPGKPHPRNFGTFPRVLAYYCRERKLFPLEEAIRRMTSMPASRLGIPDRGLIRAGMRADLVLFNFEELEDTPNFQNAQQACKGIRRVWVNGVLTAKDGVHTGARAGMVLRKGQL